MNLVGDLDRIMTVEKPVVAQWMRVAGCVADEEARDLGRALARKRARFAFPNDFNEFATRLQRRIQEKHDRQSEEGKALRSLREIRVRAAPDWAADQVALTFLFIRNDDQPDFSGQSWDALLTAWLNLVPPSGRFSPVGGIVIGLDDVTAREYVESDPLDLDQLSRSVQAGQ